MLVCSPPTTAVHYTLHGGAREGLGCEAGWRPSQARKPGCFGSQGSALGLIPPPLGGYQDMCVRSGSPPRTPRYVPYR